MELEEGPNKYEVKFWILLNRRSEQLPIDPRGYRTAVANNGFAYREIIGTAAWGGRKMHVINTVGNEINLRVSGIKIIKYALAAAKDKICFLQNRWIVGCPTGELIFWFINSIIDDEIGIIAGNRVYMRWNC